MCNFMSNPCVYVLNGLSVQSEFQWGKLTERGKRLLRKGESSERALPHTLWGGRVHSHAQRGMSKSWYRWGGVGRCSPSSPKHPARRCTQMIACLVPVVNWPAAQPLTRSCHQVEIPPEKCPDEDGDRYFLIPLQDLFTFAFMCTILLTWSHSDCNTVPTSSLHCCCCREWSFGGTNSDSSVGNSSASCSSPDTAPDSRCSVALLHAFCDTRASVNDSSRRTWPQHTVFPSALQS